MTPTTCPQNPMPYRAHGVASNCQHAPVTIFRHRFGQNLRHLRRAAQRSGSADPEPEDAAYLEDLLGDSAGRVPKRLSDRAQRQLQQLQQLRAERRSSGSLAQTSGASQPTHASEPHRHSNGNGSHAADRSPGRAAEAFQPERPLSKAELRGTLGTVNRKVYEQVAQSRNRLSTKLSAANRQVRQLQKAAESHGSEVAVLHDSMQKIMAELMTLSRVADTAAASARFGADRQQTSDKMQALQDRMALLRQVVQGEAQKLDRLTQRQIPVVWFGIAQEVRLMGDFDNWTIGFALSAEDLSDGTFTKFQAVLRLVPGTYQVKFLVDGEWRPAPDWPTVETEHGTNNVLSVE